MAPEEESIIPSSGWAGTITDGWQVIEDVLNEYRLLVQWVQGVPHAARAELLEVPEAYDMHKFSDKAYAYCGEKIEYLAYWVQQDGHSWQYGTLPRVQTKTKASDPTEVQEHFDFMHEPDEGVAKCRSVPITSVKVTACYRMGHGYITLKSQPESLVALMKQHQPEAYKHLVKYTTMGVI